MIRPRFPLIAIAVIVCFVSIPSASASERRSPPRSKTLTPAKLPSRPPATATAQSEPRATASQASQTNAASQKQSTTFTVRTSELGAGTWIATSLNAEAGQSVQVEVTLIDDLKDEKDARKPTPQIAFKVERSENPACAVRFSRVARAGEVQKSSFGVPSGGRIRYATEGKLSAKVTLTLSDGNPSSSGVTLGGSSSGGTVTESQQANGTRLGAWAWKQLAENHEILSATLTGRGVAPAEYKRYFLTSLGGNGYVANGETIQTGALFRDTIEALVFRVEYINKARMVMVGSGTVYVGYGKNSDSATLLEIEAPGIGSMDGTFTATKSLQERMMGDAFRQMGR